MDLWVYAVYDLMIPQFVRPACDTYTNDNNLLIIGPLAELASDDVHMRMGPEVVVAKRLLSVASICLGASLLMPD